MTRPTAQALFDEHHRVIFTFLLRMIGDFASAEDLTQEVFVRAMRRLDRYDARGRDRSWLFKIARNLLRDRQREADRKPPLDPLDETLSHFTGATPIRTLAVRESLSALPDVEREALLLVELGGMSYDEIASLQRVTNDAVRSRVYRARRQMRALLSDVAPGARPDDRSQESRS